MELFGLCIRFPFPLCPATILLISYYYRKIKCLGRSSVLCVDNKFAQMSISKRVIVFSRRPAPILLGILTKLRERECQILLVVSAPGANYAMHLTAIPSMGSLASTIIDEFEDPPPVLCITKMSQVEAIYLALDPDLAMVAEFPYKITPKLLGHRS